MVKDDEALSVFRTMTYEGKLTPDLKCNLKIILPINSILRLTLKVLP